MALSLTLQPNLDQPASLLVFCGVEQLRVVVTETIMNKSCTCVSFRVLCSGTVFVCIHHEQIMRRDTTTPLHSQCS
jgi:hypothetical protein